MSPCSRARTDRTASLLQRANGDNGADHVLSKKVEYSLVRFPPQRLERSAAVERLERLERVV